MVYSLHSEHEISSTEIALEKKITLGGIKPAILHGMNVVH